MKEDLIAGLVFIFLLLVGFVYIPAQLESWRYNKLTGSETSWIDALVLDLRVTENTKEKQ